MKFKATGKFIEPKRCAHGNIKSECRYLPCAKLVTTSGGGSSDKIEDVRKDIVGFVSPVTTTIRKRPVSGTRGRKLAHRHLVYLGQKNYTDGKKVVVMHQSEYRRLKRIEREHERLRRVCNQIF